MSYRKIQLNKYIEKPDLGDLLSNSKPFIKTHFQHKSKSLVNSLNFPKRSSQVSICQELSVPPIGLKQITEEPTFSKTGGKCPPLPHLRVLQLTANFRFCVLVTYTVLSLKPASKLHAGSSIYMWTYKNSYTNGCVKMKTSQ